MTRDSSSDSLTKLHRLLVDHFDLDELRTLCFDLKVDFDILRGEEKSAKARELITVMLHQNRLAELAGKLQGLRPKVAWLNVETLSPEERLAWTTATEMTSAADYLVALRDYCANLPYLTLHDIRPPKTLDEVYVPLKVRPQPQKEKQDLRGLGDLEGLERHELLSISDVMRRHDPPHVLILGEPGAGKSTLLRQLAEHAWDAPGKIGLDGPHLPILVPLRRLAAAEGALEESLNRALTTELGLALTQALPQGFFTNWPKQTGANWLILLDALDEVPAGQRPQLMQWLKGLLGRVGHNRIALTSRPSGYTQGELDDKLFGHYDLLSFTPDQTGEFARNWFGDKAEPFVKELDRVRAGALSGTPLLLTIAAKVYLEKGRLPERRSGLYGQFVDIWLTEAEQRGMRAELGDAVCDVAKFALARLALAMTEQPMQTVASLSKVVTDYLRGAVPLSPDRAETEGERFLKVMARCSGVFTRHGDVYDFIHPIFQEYFAAMALSRLDYKRRLDFARNYRASLDWQNILVLTASFLDEQQCGEENSSQFIRALVAGSHPPSFWLRSRPVKDIVVLWQRITLNSGYRLTQRVEDATQLALFCAAECLAEDVKVNNQVRDLILSRLNVCTRSYVIPLCELAAQAMARLGCTSYRDATAEIALSMLTAPWYKTRKAGAEILEKLEVSLPDLESALVVMLDDPEAEVRRAAATALGRLKMSSPDVQQHLFELILTDREKQHRPIALEYEISVEWFWRGDLAFDEVVPGQFIVVPAAAEALAAVGGATPSRVDAICNLLQSSDPHARQTAACALGRLGQPTPQVVSALINALSDTYRSGDWGEPPEQQGIVGTTRWVVLEAARSLLLLKQTSSQVVSALADALKNERAYSRPEGMADETLQRVGTEGLEAVEALVAQIPLLGRAPASPDLLPLWEKGEKRFIEAMLTLSNSSEDWASWMQEYMAKFLGYVETPSTRVYNALLMMLTRPYQSTIKLAWLSLYKTLSEIRNCAFSL
jgi:HEAT repeat protein/energy-coupling factor transporter ATP-binding protein EcfA2